MLKKLAIAVFLVGGVARAGYKAASTADQVSVDTTNRVAQGALGQARNSTDSVQYIGCIMYTWTDAPTWGICSAKDAAGHTATCSVFDTSLLDRVQNIKGDSWIKFEWDTSATCTYLEIYNTSYMAPKQL